MSRVKITRRSLLGAASIVVVACAFAFAAPPVRAQGWGQGWGQFWEYQPPRHRPRTRSRAVAPAERVGKEPFGQIPKGPLQIVISIDQQKLHLYSDGTEIAEAPVATGVPGHPTPVGVFSVIEKNVLHHSNIYSGAPMPYMQRITWSGVALHEGGNLGHPASHGCIRMPHDFATRLYVLTKLGARVIIARPELRPTDFADAHLFVHKDIAPASDAAASAPEKPIKTALTLEDGKTIDVPTVKPADGPPTAAKDATTAADGASAKPDDPASGIGLRDTIGADTPATNAGDPPAGATASDAPQAVKPGAAEAALEAPVPVPPAKPIEIARTASKTPISIFISRKEKKLYVRQDFLPLFDAPITIDHPDEYLGTHVFTAMEYLDDHSHFRWNVVTLPAEPPRMSRKAWRAAAMEARSAKGKRRGEIVAPPVPQPLTPQEALARIEIPPDVIERISQLIVPGSSLVISDQGLGGETGRGTDFIVVMR